MVCSKLKRGFDGACYSNVGRFIQRAVLINYTDVVFQAINNNDTMHNIVFALFNPTNPTGIQRRGYNFTAPVISDSIRSEYSMKRSKGVITYNHSMEIILNGVDENIKILQKQLDGGMFLGATKYSDGTIQILGSENGLQVEPYTYADSGVITLSSIIDEYSVPYIYAGDEEDFDNGWNNTKQVVNLSGEFNKDFSKDFRVDFLIL